MEHMRFKFTLARNWDGAFNRSVFPMDYMGGEGVLSHIFRTAVYTLILSADNRNLATTGNPQYAPTTPRSEHPPGNWEVYTNKYYLRNWVAAEALLGDKAPSGLKDAVAELRDFKLGQDLHRLTFNAVERHSKSLLPQLLAIDGLAPRDHAYAVELLLGMDIRVDTEYDKDAKKQKVRAFVAWPMRERYRWSSKERLDEVAKAPPYPAQVSIRVDDPDKTFEKPIAFDFDSTKRGTNGKTGTVSKQLVMAGTTTDPYDLNMTISLTVGGKTFEYQRALPVNKSRKLVGRNMYASERIVPITGTIVRDMHGEEVFLRLANGVLVPMMHPEGMPLPVTLADGTTIDNVRDYGWLQEGDRVRADYVTSEVTCGSCMHVTLLDTGVEEVKPIAVRLVSGTSDGADALLSTLFDGDRKKDVAVAKADEKPITLEFEFAPGTTINGAAAYAAGASGLRMYIPTADGRRMFRNSRMSHAIPFKTVKTDKLIVEFPSSRDVKLRELRFLHNTRRTDEEQWIWRKLQ
jgi:hypothetical protein